jgi:iron complex transport system ATP-binding protein
LTQVYAGYGAAEVLRGVDFEVRAGEAWAVLGPNGAGKSTLARVLLGLLPARAGRVEVVGLALPGASPRQVAKKVAWVPQVMRDDAGFTALELALLGRVPHLGGWGLPSAKDEARARACLEELGVDALANKPLAELSGGERRRVWVARALVQAPELLVLDEPTAFLDVKHQVEVLRAVRRRVDAGLGVVAVLHDANLAAHFATHALLLKDGAVLARGSATEVLDAERLTALYDIEMHAASAAERVHVPRWR